MSSPIRIQSIPSAPHLKTQALEVVSSAKSMPIPTINQSQSPDNSLLNKKITQTAIADEKTYKINNITLTTIHGVNVNLTVNVKRQILTESTQLHNAIDQDPDDMDLRLRKFKILLQFAGMLTLVHKIKLYEESARDTVKIIKDFKYFTHQGHYAEHLMNVYEGVDCAGVADKEGIVHPSLDKVRPVIHQLRRALALNPSSQDYTTALQNIEIAIRTILDNLKNDHRVEESEHKASIQQLQEILTECPFKAEFIAHPILFKLIKNAPTTFQETYPHLKDADAFVRKYPEAATIQLPKDYDLKTLKDTLDNSIKNPLTIILPFINLNYPIISPAIADIFEKAMLKNPRLRIKLCWNEDYEALNNAFMKDDNVLSYSLAGNEYQYAGHTYRIVVLNPNKLPTIKK